MASLVVVVCTGFLFTFSESQYTFPVSSTSDQGRNYTVAALSNTIQFVCMIAEPDQLQNHNVVWYHLINGQLSLTVNFVDSTIPVTVTEEFLSGEVTIQCGLYPTVGEFNVMYPLQLSRKITIATFGE